MKKYWHVTMLENLLPIIENGLKVNEQGKIYLFKTFENARSIAFLQLCLDEYVLFGIDSSCLDMSRLKPDNISELIAPDHRIYDLPIPAQYVSLKGVYRAIYRPQTTCKPHRIDYSD